MSARRHRRLVLLCPLGLLCGALAGPVATRDPRAEESCSFSHESMHSLITASLIGENALAHLAGLSYQPLFWSPAEMTALMFSSGLGLFHRAICSCFVRDDDPHDHQCVCTLIPPSRHRLTPMSRTDVAVKASQCCSLAVMEDNYCC